MEQIIEFDHYNYIHTHTYTVEFHSPPLVSSFDLLTKRVEELQVVGERDSITTTWDWDWQLETLMPHLRYSLVINKVIEELQVVDNGLCKRQYFYNQIKEIYLFIFKWETVPHLVDSLSHLNVCWRIAGDGWRHFQFDSYRREKEWPVSA